MYVVLESVLEVVNDSLLFVGVMLEDDTVAVVDGVSSIACVVVFANVVAVIVVS